MFYVKIIIVMASGSLNSEGQRKIRVMSLDYIKSSIIKKTSSKSVCICAKDVGLNLDDEVEHATSRSTDLDCSPVNGECKNGTCKHCGRTIRKHKPGFFKFLRKRWWWKNNNLGADSINNKSSNNKVITDTANCAFPSMPSDFKSKDNNLSYKEGDDKPYCDVSANEMLDNSTKCNLNSKLGAGDETLERPFTHSIERINGSLSSIERVVCKESGSNEPLPIRSFQKSVTDSNGNLDSKEFESDSQNAELVPLPSPNTRSLTCELLKLSKYGWYWGPISREEAEEKLHDQPDGAFLVRDSSADHYLLSLSFRSSGKLLHTRIEHSQGLFSFYHQPEQEGFATIGELIDHSVSFSQSAVFCYSRPRSPGHPAFPVRLTKPVSRFTQVRSLQYLCRFVIRQYIRVDNIENLPLPKRIKGYIQEGHY